MIIWFVSSTLFKCSVTLLCYIEPTWPPQVETKLITVHDPLHGFLNLVCKYFVEKIIISHPQGIGL